MITHLKSKFAGKRNLINFALILMGLLGLYLIFAWASYSPLDNAWSVASSVTEDKVLNKTGVFGAWAMDLLYAFFGKVSFIVPFSLLGVAAYMLVLRLADEITWKYVVLRVGSFLLLLIGLSGLASVVLSNSAYYLSGGFIGGMFQSLLAGTIGQFGALLVAMIFTGIGFYFCSGQSLLPLLASFYEWIIGKKEANEQTEGDLQKTDENTPLADTENTAEQAENETEQASETKFTDPSMFIRPNISGLRTATEQESSVKTLAEENLTDPTMFTVEEQLDLPKVNIQGLAITPSATAVEENIEIDVPNVEAIDLPKIRLNPLTQPTLATEVEDDETEDGEWEIATEDEEAFEEEILEEEKIEEPSEPLELPAVETPAFVQDVKPTIHLKPLEESKVEPVLEETAEDDYELQLAAEFERAERERLAQMKQRAEAQGLEQTYNNIVSMPNAAAPAAEPTIRVNMPTSAPEPKLEANTPNYLKGYGDTLIHPLLQRNHAVEKPTTPLPTLELLDDAPVQAQQITEQEIIETSRRLESALANYGVKATVEDVLVGPVVTRYEIKPAAGVKAAKVTGLASDLARELMFKAIRITEVVPGKPYMGIETPNAHRETVWLRDVLDSDAFRNSKATLPMALGKDISGEPIVVDMAKMPHLLVAGQTGGGKSVGVNTMILSLLFKLTPEQVRFIMIDPKVVELSIYNDIPHLLTPVVTDMKKAANALRWAVEEMERRYLLVSHLQVRNIEGYNDKIDQATAMNFPIPDPTWRPGDSMEQMPPALEKLSYIVLIVDEFADLMMSAGKEVEEYIMRIAQKARAVGIHLILATQRPSTDVITGVIKANIPSRIAFTVASQIDSRTILDAGGAEALLGRGDMLYSGAGSPDIIRVHGAFMTDEEVQRVADNWRARGKPNYLESIVESVEDSDTGSRAEAGGDLDPLFDEIVEYVIESGVTSISSIQRRFSLGFNRAGRIVDQMEAQGIISEPGKGGKREVLAR